MKIIFLSVLILLFQVQFSVAQRDTTVYYGSNGKVVDKDSANEIVVVKEIKKKTFLIQTFVKSDDNWILLPNHQTVTSINDTTFKINTVYSENDRELVIRKYSKQGDKFFFQDFYRKKKVLQMGYTTSLFPLHLEGELKKFYKTGYTSSIELYKDNQLQSNRSWLSNGQRYIDNVYSKIDQPAQYPGGFNDFWKYIDENLRYPGFAKQFGIQGTVHIHFVVDKKGNTIGEYVEKSVHPYLDAEALRLIKEMSVTWQPAMLNGKYVNTSFSVPIDFYIETIVNR